MEILETTRVYVARSMPPLREDVPLVEAQRERRELIAGWARSFLLDLCKQDYAAETAGDVAEQWAAYADVEADGSINPKEVQA